MHVIMAAITAASLTVDTPECRLAWTSRLNGTYGHSGWMTPAEARARSHALRAELSFAFVFAVECRPQILSS